MSLRKKLFRQMATKGRSQLTPTQIIAIVFLIIIALGTLLLSLPIASRSGISCGFRPALFTATSATCVTGLVLYDTWTQWSGFGQAVILCLIELGGLGFMTAASLVILLLRKKVGVRQRMVMAQALSMSDMDSVVRLQKWVLVGSLLIQFTGAMILFLHFLPSFGWETAAKWSVFHAVSAFCNAGFDIVGCLQPGASMMVFQHDPVVLLTLSGLVVLGGLGFFVWEEVVRVRSWKKFSVYTKLVLLITGALLIGGTVGFCLLEWNNPDTLGPMSVPDKILNGFFQSVTVRTAGFMAVDQGLLTSAGKGLSMGLMLIGGSSGSTAGGVKTVTLLVLVLFMVARARGRNSVCVFKSTIPASQVMDAMTIVAILVGLAFFGAIFISATSPVGFTDGLYEAVSALATVGLSSVGTANLSVSAQILIIIYMYFGRVGVLTLSLGFLMGNKAEDRFRYAQTNLLIG
ncbi:MAG: potassium uptake protein, TrkH family [Oscillospiraceae bacterium]|nr:potassium uptake protein, TrkH family [Oscillospiraceae bacterium]